jgi:hypothetical protein
MSEEAVKAAEAPEQATEEAGHDEIHYQAVEKDGNVTAIWEMRRGKSTSARSIRVPAKASRSSPFSKRPVNLTPACRRYASSRENTNADLTAFVFFAPCGRGIVPPNWKT